MSTVKGSKNQTVTNNKLMRKYAEVMSRAPIIMPTAYHLSNLKQPSLLEDVDSVTTYEVSATIREWK